MYYVHHLVAECFIPKTDINPDGTKMKGRIMVNHKDGNTLNNSVNNLEWCDYSYNNRNRKLFYQYYFPHNEK